MCRGRLQLLIPVILLFLLAILAGVVWKETPPQNPTHADTEAPSVFETMRMRLREIDTASTSPHSPSLAAAVAVARERRESMRALIQNDPEQALREAISRAEYRRLPEALRPFFERPFNETATLRVLPVCGGDLSGQTHVLEIGATSWQASVFGVRAGTMTKEATPLAGITLDELAAVREFPFEPLDAEDAVQMADAKLGQSDATRDFSTGRPLSNAPLTALAGGKRYLFESAESLEAFNRRLAALDAAPGPHAGAQVCLADGVDGAGDGFDWDAAGEIVRNEASAWTETKKTVFFIRVDFSDVPGEAISQAGLAGTLNTTVSDTIEAMSYGKTWIEAEVSESTVRMPKPSTDYLPADNNLLHSDAKTAYEATYGAGVLANYDIVGVHFAGIGISSGGLTYAGLAGGSRQWLQGTGSSNVIVHEFGHNYGIGHASFWQTSDGSVAGTGSSVEYGDPFDIMGSGPDPEGHFHMQAKQALNWLGSGEWADASAAGSGSYRIYRFDDTATTGTLRGLRISKAASPAEYYWLGYRPAIPGNAWLDSGAYLVWQRPGYTRGWLLDSTPASAGGKNDAALDLGTTFSDPAASVHITPTATGGSGAEAWLDVNVQIGPFPGNRVPTAELFAPPTVLARSAAIFSATASDPDNDPLAYAWSFGDSAPTPNAASVAQTWTVGGTYVAGVTVSDMKGGIVTRSATVSVTDPLDTWTPGSVGAARTVNAVAYVDGRFIATGNGYAYLSFDGENWQERALGSNFRSGGAATDGTRFVIAGADWDGSQWIAVIHRSTDGRSWERLPLPSYPELNAIEYANGAFVAVGDDGTVLRSVDGGQSWTLSATPGSADLSSIAYGGGVFVAVGGTSVYTSPDGAAWSDRSGGHTLPAWQSFDAVLHADGVFYAGGWYSGVHRSADGGMTWAPATMTNGRSYDIDTLSATDGTLIALGKAVSGATGPVLLVSGDGESWTESASATVPDTSTSAFGDGVFLTVHGSGLTSRSAPFYPDNSAPTAAVSAPAAAAARDVILMTADATDPDGDPLTLVWDFGDGTPLTEGSTALHVFPTGGTYTVTLTATDLRGGVTTATQTVTVGDPLGQWTQRVSGTAAGLNDIALGNGRLVAVGTDSGTYRVSDDGIAWSGGTLAVNMRLEAVIHDGAQFVAVGWDYDFGAAGWRGVIYTAPDGLNWTRRLFGGEELIDVAFGGGIYVATGHAGTLWRSENGTAWTPVATGTATDLTGVSYGGGGFVAVGAGGGGGPATVLTSANGLTWTDASAGAGTAVWQGFYDVAMAANLSTGKMVLWSSFR